MCPYEPKHLENSIMIRKDVIENCTKEELQVIKSK